MEFKETVLNIDALKWIKDNLGISETEENELKELELLLEQREKMLEILESIIDGTAFDKESGLIWEHRLKAIEQLIKEPTEL